MRATEQPAHRRGPSARRARGCPARQDPAGSGQHLVTGLEADDHAGPPGPCGRPAWRRLRTAGKPSRAAAAAAASSSSATRSATTSTPSRARCSPSPPARRSSGCHRGGPREVPGHRPGRRGRAVGSRSADGGRRRAPRPERRSGPDATSRRAPGPPRAVPGDGDAGVRRTSSPPPAGSRPPRRSGPLAGRLRRRPRRATCTARRGPRGRQEGGQEVERPVPTMSRANSVNSSGWLIIWAVASTGLRGEQNGISARHLACSEASDSASRSRPRRRPGGCRGRRTSGCRPAGPPGGGPC